MALVSGPEIAAAISLIITFVKENFILCGFMLISYFVLYFYEFIHTKSQDSDVYEIDIVSSGLSSIMVAFMLVGLDESSKGFDFSHINFSEPTTKMAAFLVAYALMLIVLGFTKILPRLFVIILGNSELDFFINFTAVLMTEKTTQLTPSLILVIAAPLTMLFLSLRIKRMMG